MVQKNRNMQLVVEELAKPVYRIEEDGRRVGFGEVISRIYTGEGVQSHFLKTGDHEYALGPTSTSFKTIDHAEVLSPLLKRGYTLQKIRYPRGGVKMWAVLVPENPAHVTDPVKWDHELWRGLRDDKSLGGALEESIVVISSLAPGHGIHYLRGWFRQVCTNGLVSKFLDMGRVILSHTEFHPDKVKDLFAHWKVPKGQSVMGPYVGNRHGVERLISYLGMKDEELEKLEIPFLIKDSFQAATNRTAEWFRQDLSNQFQMMLDGNVEKVHVLDLVNAVTNTVHVRELSQERQLGRHLLTTERSVNALATLLSSLSLA